MVHEFINRENEYLDWIAHHPRGFVVTTSRGISLTYLALHRANCRMVGRYMKNMSGPAFTGKAYIKVCASSIEELHSWIVGKGGDGFTKICKHCQPIDKEILLNDELQDRVAQSMRDPSEVRIRRLRLASKKPEARYVYTKQFVRNPDVVAQKLYLAGGHCELCKKAAPFLRRNDGTPFLEVHHKITLADGGDDTVENALALCPNCHRKLHFG